MPTRLSGRHFYRVGGYSGTVSLVLNIRVSSMVGPRVGYFVWDTVSIVSCFRILFIPNCIRHEGNQTKIKTTTYRSNMKKLVGRREEKKYHS